MGINKVMWTNIIRMVGLLTMLIPVTESVEYKIGMIVERHCCHWSALYRSGGAVNIAMDHLRANHILDGVDFRYFMILSTVFKANRYIFIGGSSGQN